MAGPDNMSAIGAITRNADLTNRKLPKGVLMGGPDGRAQHFAVKRPNPHLIVGSIFKIEFRDFAGDLEEIWAEPSFYLHN
jgi:hypothetical protein